MLLHRLGSWVRPMRMRSLTRVMASDSDQLMNCSGDEGLVGDDDLCCPNPR